MPSPLNHGIEMTIEGVVQIKIDTGATTGLRETENETNTTRAGAETMTKIERGIATRTTETTISPGIKGMIDRDPGLKKGEVFFGVQFTYRVFWFLYFFLYILDLAPVEMIDTVEIGKIGLRDVEADQEKDEGVDRHDDMIDPDLDLVIEETAEAITEETIGQIIVLTIVSF